MMNQYQRYQNQPYQAPPAPLQRHLYSGQHLAILAGGYVVSWILFFAEPSIWRSASESSTTLSPGIIGILGTIGLISIVVAVLINDWRGLTTMNGWLKWGRMKIWQRIVVGYFFIGLSVFLVGIYLIQAYQTYRQNKEQEPIRLRQKIAEQEAELGIIPQTAGTCRNCHKPLQIGAEFCAYCGATVIERPRICPNCATTTLPDAQWCPKCRTRLTSTY